MYGYTMYYLIIDCSERPLIDWHMILSTCHFDLDTNRFHLYSDVAIRHLALTVGANRHTSFSRSIYTLSSICHGRGRIFQE